MKRLEVEEEEEEEDPFITTTVFNGYRRSMYLLASSAYEVSNKVTLCCPKTTMPFHLSPNRRDGQRGAHAAAT